MMLSTGLVLFGLLVIGVSLFVHFHGQHLYRLAVESGDWDKGSYWSQTFLIALMHQDQLPEGKMTEVVGNLKYYLDKVHPAYATHRLANGLLITGGLTASAGIIAFALLSWGL